ncbi:unnamed protein product [Caenorhabditis auriculariae]|uniref:DM domain-containing protein n=1 Tax=Caenorhabditis auriculariae TaxID=2777116 RepID=A0A8S1HQB0_9PELO|nr:unnamed protein product [Caenorhabditis auriculariae]
MLSAAEPNSHSPPLNGVYSTSQKNGSTRITWTTSEEMAPPTKRLARHGGPPPATRLPCTGNALLAIRRLHSMPKEQYMCQLCANHGIFNQPKKGHKQKCPYRTCPCSLCALNTKRRALDQIERQLKITNESSTTPGCPTSPSSTKLQTVPTEPSSPFQEYRQSVLSQPIPFSVQLPATITRRELKLLRREELMPPPSSPNLKRPCKTLDDAIEHIKKHKSIFHSAEMLAMPNADFLPTV